MPATTGFFVAAYTSAPSNHAWEPELEARFYEALGRDRRIRGLEQPVMPHLHPHDDGWLLEALAPDWELVLTTIPGVMPRLREMPSFGLASRDEQGRAAALRFMEEVRAQVERLPRVLAVQLHSAPTNGGSGEAFARSLRELSAWDWRGAQLVVEHCDSWRCPTPRKGFLTLDEELDALAGTAVGLTINWGRSAIDAHSAGGAVAHIAQARAAGVPVRGVMFSGVTEEWRDTHAPFAADDPASLLTPATAEQTLAAADPAVLSYAGIKLFEAGDIPLERRIAVNRNALALLADL